MSKIVSMSSGAIDPIAVTKRVFWRPTTTGTALLVGDPVCYKLDAVDHKERTVDPVHLGLTRDTYAEGEQEMTGRLFNVEEPLVDNLDNFAGIVKCLGPSDGADGDFIEIYCANSGAVVPANVVLTATVTGRTILSVMSGTRTLGNPTQDIRDFLADSDDDTAGSIDSKVVGVAMETITAAGLCWVKLDENNFIHQGGQVDQEFEIAAGAVDVTVNKMNVEFNLTAGHCQMLHYRARLAGTGGDAHRGVYRFETIMEGVPAQGTNHVFGLHTHLEIGGAVPSGGGNHLSPLKIGIRTQNVDPDLSGCGVLAAIHIDWILRATTTGTLTNMPVESCIIYVNEESAGSAPEFFIRAERARGIAGTEYAVADSSHAAFDGDSIIYQVKCLLGSDTVYFLAGTPSTVAD